MSRFFDAEILNIRYGPIADRAIYNLAVIKLDVPVQIVTPALRGVPQPDCNTNRWRRIWSPRMAHQLHARFSRRASPFPPIAANAAGDDVLPVLPAALRHRENVIERQFGDWEYVAAVLTGVVVPRVDVRAREGHVIEPTFYFDEAKKSNDRRQLETEGNRPYLAVVDRDDLHLPLAPERDGFLPVYDLQRLVRCVQQERLLHTFIYDAGRRLSCQECVAP
jgi:hypothetical protein